MRPTTPLLAALLFASPAVLLAGCSLGGAPAVAVAADHAATLKIDGMTCASCSVTVRTAARQLPGLASVEVDVDNGVATVTFDAKLVSAEAIAKKITDAGYVTTVVSNKELTDGVL